jgi:hypothetical protein
VKPCFATIVAPNYLAYARVLGDSLSLHAPDAEFDVLVVGRPDAAAQEAVRESGLKVTYATELGLPDFEQLAYKYDLVELNTALKPTFLKALFARGHDHVIYLDPDIRLYDAPTPIFDALQEAETALIPHALAPAMDGLRPSDIDFLRTGVFNLGFAAFRRGESAFALLDWWEQRCLAQGFNDPGFGTFVDQKWMDLAPCYFDRVRVVKHPGCNVAYWNLHERRIDLAGDGHFRVNGAPLVFFHFSGVNAAAPHLLSKHQNRHTLQPGTPLAGLVSEYCGLLMAAGHGKWSSLPYSFAKLDDGAVITPLMRRAACVQGVDAANPFSAASTIQKTLRAAGMEPATGTQPASVTTLNFDATQARVVWANRLVRFAARVIGAARVMDLIRYANFLGWQSNYPAVLLDRPFELRHTDNRDRKAS